MGIRSPSAVAVAGLLAVAGCVTPQPGDDGQSPVGPISLRKCDGVSVANAPPADRNGRLDLASHISVRGVALSRTPSQACLSSGFGPRRRGRRHEGVDLYTGRPAPVAAAAAGEVSFVGRLRGYGLTVDVRHGRGVVTRYAHLSRVGVDPGARLKSGARIGLTGSTGNATAVHLHYEIRVDGRPINPLAGP